MGFDPDYKLFGKRWMSRRELVDKPHPPKHTITPVIHSTSGKSAVVNMNVGGINEKKKDNLVAYTGDPNHMISVKEYKTHERIVSRSEKRHSSSKNKIMNRPPTRPIQQPRKMN